MVAYYKDNSTHPSRAQQIYLYLIGAAKRREIVTYGQLARVLGYGETQGAQFLTGMLGCLMTWCSKHDLPALTVLVVNAESGLPGVGLTTVEENAFAAEQQRVFKFDWFAIHPPTIGEIKD